MTPEQLKYVRERRRDGNESRRELDHELHKFCHWNPERLEFRLSPAGLLIAKLADALEQANETVDYLRTFGSNRTSAEGNQLLVDVRANRLESLGR